MPKRLICTCLPLLGLFTPACGDDSNPAGGGSSGGTTTDADPSSTSEATADPSTTSSSSSTDAPVGSSSGDAADSSSTGSPSETVSFGGQVTDFIGILGIEGLSVGIEELDGASATTDAAGMFTFEGLEPDTPVNIVFEPLPGGRPPYAGGIWPERTGTMDRDDIAATLVQEPFIQSQLDGLASQDPVPPDLDRAIVVVRVNNPAVDGNTVSLTVDPEPAPGTFYAPNEGGAPVLDSTDIDFDTLPAAVFFNVADTEAGEITITATHSSGSLDCAVVHPHFITRGGYITQVSVRCE